MTEFTHCSDCEHVTSESRKGKWYGWTCIKFPNLGGGGFVTNDIRETEPYMKCVGINGGKCPLWQRRKDNQVNLNLEDK